MFQKYRKRIHLKKFDSNIFEIIDDTKEYFEIRIEKKFRRIYNMTQDFFN